MAEIICKKCGATFLPDGGGVWRITPDQIGKCQDLLGTEWWGDPRWRPSAAEAALAEGVFWPGFTHKKEVLDKIAGVIPK
jgi:hypothetical protein